MVNIIANNLPKGFIDSYILKDNKIIILFNKEDTSLNELTDFIEYQTNNNNCYYDIKDYVDLNQLAIFYNIPEIHKDNFECFIQGKYSQFTKQYKTILVKIYGNSTIKNNHEVTAYNTIFPETFKRMQIARRLNVDIDLIQEVLDAPDLSMELYKDPYTEQLINNIYDNKQPDPIFNNCI